MKIKKKIKTRKTYKTKIYKFNYIVYFSNTYP